MVISNINMTGYFSVVEIHLRYQEAFRKKDNIVLCNSFNVCGLQGNCSFDKVPCLARSTRRHPKSFLFFSLRNLQSPTFGMRHCKIFLHQSIKICDFGLARPMFTDAPQTVFWTDYVATRWYRAPELCGCFFARYQPTVDVWSMGCIFAELLMGKALFPGRNVVDQLTLITDILGTPAPEVIEKVRNEKSRMFLERMPKKKPVPLRVLIPDASENALDILGMMLTFDPDQRPGLSLIHI